MSIESLKEQARRHEQKEEWLKALDQYKKAIARLEADDQPDIGLYNRVGDLYVRLGRLDDAVEHYDTAMELYVEAELPNNAIAVCKKIIRNVPDRHEAYLRMGQIRAQQGFLPDARVNFLTYAERRQQAGDLDESFRALVEFCDLAPEDVDVRLAVADQMASHERVDEAVEQLSVAYRTVMHRGATEQAEEIEARVRELRPDADLNVPSDALLFAPGSGLDEDVGEAVGAFGDADTDQPSSHAEGAEDAAGAAEVDEGEFAITTSHDEALGGVEAPDGSAVEVASSHEAEEELAFEVTSAFSSQLDEEDEAEDDETAEGEEEEWDEGEAVELPLMDFSSEEDEAEGVKAEADEIDEWEDEGEPVELPLMTFDEEEDEEAEVEAELGEIRTPSAEEREEALEEAAAETAAETGVGAEEDLTLERVRSLVEERPDDVELRQRMVELAYESGDEGVLVEAYLGLGGALQRGGQTGRANAAFQQVLQLDPDNAEAQAALSESDAIAKPVREVASHEDYVDLGSLILGEEGEKTTRFVVAYEEPSGDEAADFAKMLSQFKDKVSANLEADDVRAHHDLGTAYMEMGLLDEAVSEFQQALRASADHLPTYEVLGQTFLEMGKPEAAV
ncbi:MAG: tetratricopeptide repeat protein, partial [Gemmatimonadota bacterium]